LGRYLLRRLLLIPVKFFFISGVLFLLLNLVSGPPPDIEGSGNASGRAAYVAFKRQYHLDKPILFNARFATSAGKVEEKLRVAADRGPTVDLGEAFEAEEWLEDQGNDLVRFLIPMLQAPDPALSRLAAAKLPKAAEIPLTRGETAAENARNQELLAYNGVFKGWAPGPEATPEDLAALRARWEPWWAEHRDRYEYTAGEAASTFVFDTRFAWYWRKLGSGDLGVSIVNQRPVLDSILERAPRSITLALFALSLAYFIAIPIGVFSASRPGSRTDQALTVPLFILNALPTFATGTLLLRAFAHGADAPFPNGGFGGEGEGLTALGTVRDVAWHLALPIMVYTAASLASLSRYARSGVIDVIRADFVRTARAKGLPEWQVVIFHAARNGMLPILTLLGALLPSLLGGSVVIETVFNIAGMGRYLIDSIRAQDFIAVMGVLLVSSVLTLIGVFLSDVAYALADPRISFEDQGRG
jgi:peptide/nickel transport system permease protein